MDGMDFALLKFCLEANDAPNLHETRLERDPEDYVWLRKVMESLPSVAKQMKQCIKILLDTVEEDKISALEMLQDLVEDVDNANDLAKIGLGEVTQAMTYRLEDENQTEKAAEVRWMACWVISTLAQNNPFCQTTIASQGILGITIKLLQLSKHPKVNQRALGIVSAMARDCPEGLAYFNEHKDTVVPLLVRLIEASEDSPVATKATVVLRHLSSADEGLKTAATESRVVETLLKYAKDQDHTTPQSLKDMSILTLRNCIKYIFPTHFGYNCIGTTTSFLFFLT